VSAGGTTLVIDDEEVVRHLVLTDLSTAGIDGFDIVLVLAENCPGLPVVCMSGFATQALAPLPGPFVPKPFTVEKLRETIEPLLARSREQRRQSEAARRRALDRWATTVDLVAAANARRRRHPSGESPR